MMCYADKREIEHLRRWGNAWAATCLFLLGLMLLGGCSGPQPVAYLLTPGGGGVWYLPKGAKAPTDGYLMDAAGARWLLDPWVEGREGVPSFPGLDE